MIVELLSIVVIDDEAYECVEFADGTAGETHSVFAAAPFADDGTHSVFVAAPFGGIVGDAADYFHDDDFGDDFAADDGDGY